MRQASFPAPPTRPIGRRDATAVIAGAAMGVPFGLRFACHLSSWLPGQGGCGPGGAPAGALAGAALARSRANGWVATAERVAVDLATPALFLAISAGVVVLLVRPATRRDFQASRRAERYGG